ncbi:hypothetical protein [Tenggerimyces flavus]|uniref:Uncharacterized protein n=1 Tax=Tenggerimyces flavus TaxID=1708749 RepID=A0ABV7YKC3_9ACTN|nr:hypothetical protein [Tenggerimyces flavus]MBM7789830.1 hypothetical protein [Tenggerimyces flavus]
MESEAKLLVVMDDADSWSDAFALPFRDATVVDGDGAWELEGAFDTVVIDRPGFDPLWLDRVAAELRSVVSPKARILVALGGPAAATAQSPALPGLEWDGLVLLGERPCAVLRTTGSGSGSTGVLVAAAHSAATIAEAGMARNRPRAQEVRRLLLSGEADRRRSEQALLGHLAKAAAHAEKLSVELRRHLDAAAQPVTVKALLRSSSSGRRLLGILGRAKRLLRRRSSA